MTIVQPLSLPVWDGSTTEEVLTASDTNFQSLTIPTGATAVLLSSLGTAEWFVSPVTTAQSGIRVGGVSARNLLLRLGDSPTIRVKGNTGGGETMGALYFFGQPPGGSCIEPLDVPTWDDQIFNEEYSNAAGATSQVFVPPIGSGMFTLSVVEAGAVPNVSYVSTEDTDDTGVRIGGDTGSHMLARFQTRILQTGNPTTDDDGGGGAGDDLIDALGDFENPNTGIAVGDPIRNDVDGSFARITVIDSPTRISHTALLHGVDNEWARLTDTYTIYKGPSIFVHNPDAVSAVDVGLLVFRR